MWPNSDDIVFAPAASSPAHTRAMTHRPHEPSTVLQERPCSTAPLVKRRLSSTGMHQRKRRLRSARRRQHVQLSITLTPHAPQPRARAPPPPHSPCTMPMPATNAHHQTTRSTDHKNNRTPSETEARGCDTSRQSAVVVAEVCCCGPRVCEDERAGCAPSCRKCGACNWPQEGRLHRKQLEIRLLREPRPASQDPNTAQDTASEPRETRDSRTPAERGVGHGTFPRSLHLQLVSIRA